jgi:hypothetical protein
VDVTVLRKGQRMTLSPVLEEPRSEGSFKMPGDGWKQAGPGEWHFEGPNGQKRIVIRRSGDDDGDVHIEGPGGGRRIVIQHDSGDDEDRAEMQRQIEELQKQVEQLKQQMATPAPKPAPKKTTTKK